MNKNTVMIATIAVFVVGIVGGNFVAKKVNDEAAKIEETSAPAQPQTQEQDIDSMGYGSKLIGKMRPSFELPDLENTTRSIDEWTGKALVVNFWASWCAPCRKEIPMFNRVQQKYGQDLQFIGIAVDEREPVEQFMSTTPIEYPVLVSASTGVRVAKDYGNIDGIFPYTVFVDREGIVRYAVAGELHEEATEEAVKEILGLTPG